MATAGFTEEYLLDAERAEQLYDDCAARLPRNHLALQLLASFFQRSGQAQRSTMLLRAAASADPQNLGVQWLLAQNLSESGDVEGAETALREAATRNASPEAWRLLAQQQRNAGSLRRALASLDAALALAGDSDPLLRFTRADLLIDLGEFESAAASVAGLQPRVFEQLILGRCALLGGEAERALQHFESGLADWPDHVQVRRLAGQAALQLGDRERAISHLREALRGDPREPTTGLHLARLLAEAGRHREALRIAHSVRRLTQADLHWQAGLVAATALTGLGRADEARGVLEALAEGEKSDQRALALAGLARLEARSGETERALELLDRARASEPAGGQYAYEAAQIALQAGKPGLAEERLRAVVAHHPELLEARNDLAWLLAERGADLDVALSLARDAWAGLEDARSLDTLGWVHLKRGEIQRARRALEAALSLRPDATETRRRLTLAMHATGEETQPAPSSTEPGPR